LRSLVAVEEQVVGLVAVVLWVQELQASKEAVVRVSVVEQEHLY
jgi:hypothetical protein